MIVRPFVAQAVLEALVDLGIDSWIVHEAKGYSRQKGYLERYVGSEYSLAFLPKVEISLWANRELNPETLSKIQEIARTGRIGDGKIFVVPLAWQEELEF